MNKLAKKLTVFEAARSSASRVMRIWLELEGLLTNAETPCVRLNFA